MIEARCQCGQLRATVAGPSEALVVCHCSACQRRSGAPFGVLAYYPATEVTITGEATRFSRDTDAGREYVTGFCPACGTSLYGFTASMPERIGIATGAFEPADQPAPHRSVWEENRHSWVAMPANIPRFPKGRR